MTTAADSLRAMILPLLPGWRIQYGRWIDAGAADRYIVIRPAGGVSAELLRRPQYSVAAISAANDAATVASGAAELIVSTVRAAAGDLPFFEAGEPVFMATDDGRTVFEIAVSTITD